MTVTQHPAHPETASPAAVVGTTGMDWIATGPGKSFRPLRFDADGWSELMRLEPGADVAWHRHTGDVHAYNFSGLRRIHNTGQVLGPGDYVYEPVGNVDTWGAVGDELCIVHIKVVGAVEYVDERGAVYDVADTRTQQATYLAWCSDHGVRPDPNILS